MSRRMASAGLRVAARRLFLPLSPQRSLEMKAEQMNDQARQDGFNGSTPHEACSSRRALRSAFPPSSIPSLERRG